MSAEKTRTKLFLHSKCKFFCEFWNKWVNYAIIFSVNVHFLNVHLQRKLQHH